MKLIGAALVAGAVFALLFVVNVPRPISRLFAPRRAPGHDELEFRLIVDGTSFMVALATRVRQDPHAAELGVRPELETWAEPDHPERHRTDAFLTGPDRKSVEQAIAGALAGDASLRLPPGVQLAYHPLSDGRTRTFLVQGEPFLNGASVEDAEVLIDYSVMVTFDADGARVLDEVTGANVGHKLAIMVGETITSAPIITGAITAGRAQINVASGEPEAMKEAAYDMVRNLRIGALPPMSTDTVSPGTLMLARGACALAAGVVTFFLLWAAGAWRARRRAA